MTFELVVPFMKTGIPEPLRELCILNIRLQKSNKYFVTIFNPINLK